MASLALIWDLIAVDKASGTFNRVAVSADRAAASTAKAETGIMGFGKKAVAALGALATVDIAAHFVKDAAQFQKSMTLIQTQAGASAQQVRQFSSAILSMSGKVAQAPEDLSTSLYHVYSALNKVGATGPQMLNTVKIAGEGAKVGLASVEDTTNSLTATLASGIVRFNQAGKAMGALNAIVGAGDMHFQDLNDALGTGLLVTMKTFGVSLTDTGAALAVFGDNNIRGADAATKLRMAVQDLAKPAAHADDFLSKIGLTAEDLRKHLEQGGLNDALHLLNERMTQAGITGSKVGGFLEDAFTKKAGTGLAILTQRMNQFDEARAAVQKGANGFGSAWQATTHTAAFAFDKLKAEFQAWAITVGNKLLPVVSAAATWLGTNLPKAVHALSTALTPAARMVGTVLAGAWRTFLAVVRPVVAVLSGVAHFFERSQGTASTLAITVVALWAAFKGANIVLGVVSRIPSAINRVGASLEGAAASAGAMSASQLALNGVLAVGTIALTAGIMQWQRRKQIVADAAAQETADVQALTDAIKQDSGALGENTKAWIAQKLQQSGAYDLANKLGVSYFTMTQAALGNKPALEQLTAAQKAYGSVTNAVSGSAQQLTNDFFNGGLAVKVTAGEVQKALHAYRQLTTEHQQEKLAARDATSAERTHATVIAYGADGVKELGGALRVTTGATQTQSAVTRTVTTVTNTFKDATNALKDALGGLASRLNNAAAAVAWQQSLNDLTQTFKDNKGAIEGNSAAALADQAAFISNAQTIAQHAQTMQKNGKTWQQITGYITAQYKELRQHAIDAGADGTKVDALAKKLGIFPKSIKSKIELDTASALSKLQSLVTKIDNTTGVVHITARYGNGSRRTVGALLSATGGAISGAGSGTSDSIPAMLSNGEHVLTASDVSKAGGQGAIYRMRKAIQSGALKFARGGSARGSSLMSMIAAAGFRGSAADTMYAIVMAESGGNAHAHNYNTGTKDDSYGLAQINMFGSLGPDRLRQYGLSSDNQLYNPATNLHIAYLMSNRGRNFSPWSTYNSGAYQRFLGQSGASISHGGAGGGGGGAAQARNTSISGAYSALGAVNGIIPTSQITGSNFNWHQFLRQLGTAKDAVTGAAGRGVTGRALERLNSRLEHLAKVGERVEKHLIRQTRRSARRLNLSGTAGDVLGRLRPIESGLTALGVPKSFLNRLHDDNQRLAAAVRSRNQELAKEARDTQKLINARQAMRQDRSAFRGAISGTFDITAAGANAAGKVTGLGIVAQAKQAVSRAKLWISGMKRLVHLKIFPASYLRDLFAKGPDSLDQVNALVNLPMGELKQLADAQAQLAHLSGVGAGLGTTKLDQGAVTRAQRQVHRDKQIENRREKHLEHVKDEIVHAIDHALDRLEPVSDVQLVGMVNRGQRKAKRR